VPCLHKNLSLSLSLSLSLFPHSSSSSPFTYCASLPLSVLLGAWSCEKQRWRIETLIAPPWNPKAQRHSAISESHDYGKFHVKINMSVISWNGQFRHVGKYVPIVPNRVRTHAWFPITVGRSFEWKKYIIRLSHRVWTTQPTGCFFFLIQMIGVAI
jgi:hypothetical protein